MHATDYRGCVGVGVGAVHDGGLRRQRANGTGIAHPVAVAVAVTVGGLRWRTLGIGGELTPAPE